MYDEVNFVTQGKEGCPLFICSRLTRALKKFSNLDPSPPNKSFMRQSFVVLKV